MITHKLGAQANHEKREREVAVIRKDAKEEVPRLTHETFRAAGAMIYWAEGSKRKSTSVSNSDPRIILLMVRWWRTMFDIKPQQLNAHLHIHYGNDERHIKRYWSKLTGVPLKNFGKSFVKPKGTGHRKNILPNGIIRLRVIGANTENLRHRILAWAEQVYELSKFQPPVA